MAKKIIAFLFDLDGVLIDSESGYTLIWNEIERLFPTGVENFSQKIKGTTLESILSTYFPSPYVREEVEHLLYEMENKMAYDYTDGARLLLDKLKLLKFPAVLVTSSNDIKLQHLWLQHPEMLNDFIAVIDGDMVRKSKPDPEGYLLGASKTGLNPSKCVVVEDSLQGVKAGKAAGAFVIGVAGTLPAEVLAPHSNIVVHSLKEIDPIHLTELL